MLLSSPDHFTVEYTINPHMEAGVDSERAREQWEQLRDTYEAHASVATLDPSPYASSVDAPAPRHLPDFAFCSNHALPGPEGRQFILATMAVGERAGEEKYFGAWAADTECNIIRLNSDFEGNGDAKWHPERRLLWGGYGQRSELKAYQEIARELDVPVVTLELIDPEFYHLDVCFSPLDEHSVLIAPDAFTEQGLAKIRRGWDVVIEAPEREARETLACNCHSVDGTHVVIDAANTQTMEILAAHGYTPVPVETAEFRKAGGSVACLTLPHA